MWSVVGLLFLLITTPLSSEPKDKTRTATKSFQNERKNILLGPMGPNIQSSSGSPQSSFNPKTLPSSSELPSRKVSMSKLDERNYCNPNQPDVDCSKIDGNCLDCNFDQVKTECIYGKNVNVSCIPKQSVVCKGERRSVREIVCQFCYQTPLWQQRCNGIAMCNSVGAPRNYYRANCTVVPEVLCLGSRRFHRMMPCNWKNGYKWSTTLLLSVTLGGFGADRFYLGRWQEGIGKLFSFGGLGLWTFVDIILIAVRYLGPADGSLYVD